MWEHRPLTQANPAASVGESHGLFTYRGLHTGLGTLNVTDWVNSDLFSCLSAVF